jgi:hypothetical protein
MGRSRWVWGSVLVCLWVVAAGVLPAQAQGISRLVYEITIEHPETHIVHVRAELHNLAPEQTSLKIASPQGLKFRLATGGSDNQIEYPFHSANWKAVDDLGISLPIETVADPNNPGVIPELVIFNAGASDAVLEYDIVVLSAVPAGIGQPLPDSTAYLGADYGLIDPAALLYLPTGPLEIVVKFVLPGGWSAIVDGEQQMDGSYLLTDAVGLKTIAAGELSYMTVGPFAVSITSYGDVDLVVAVQRGRNIPTERVSQYITRSFEYFTDLMTPFKQDSLIQVVIADTTPQGAYRAIIGAPSAGHSSIHNYCGEDQPCDDTWYMHIPENMATIWVDAMGVARSSGISARWLACTAVTAGRKLSMQLGDYSLDEYYQLLTSEWQSYLYHLELLGIPQAAIQLGAGQGGRMYDEKCSLVGVMLDQQIQVDTGGLLDLADVWVEVARNNPAEVTSFNLLQILSQMTGKDYAPFFNLYISGSRDVDLDFLREHTFQSTLQVDAFEATRQVRVTQEMNATSAAQQQDRLQGLVIQPDGDPADWDGMEPLLVDGSDASLVSAGADLAALYAFMDEHYLYVRIDQHGGFPQDRPWPLRYMLLISEPGGVVERIIYVDSDYPLWVNVTLAQADGNPGTAVNQPLPSAGIGEVLELVVPLEDLGVKQLQLQVMVIYQETGNGAVLDKLSGVRVNPVESVEAAIKPVPEATQAPLSEPVEVKTAEPQVDKPVGEPAQPILPWLLAGLGLGAAAMMAAMRFWKRK